MEPTLRSPKNSYMPKQTGRHLEIDLEPICNVVCMIAIAVLVLVIHFYSCARLSGITTITGNFRNSAQPTVLSFGNCSYLQLMGC